MLSVSSSHIFFIFRYIIFPEIKLCSFLCYPCHHRFFVFIFFNYNVNIFFVYLYDNKINLPTYLPLIQIYKILVDLAMWYGLANINIIFLSNYSLCPLFFISSKKLFSSSRYSFFCIFSLPSHTFHIQKNKLKWNNL